ncbi:MAG: AAA family ATPase, partial [Candidatus Heimdallarchaeaceae archaeon]
MSFNDISMSSNFIFERIILKNYKMHSYTELNLTEKPIVVISGANGTGKSQILEALILVIGHTPTRVALGKQEELIGSFADKALIQLYIKNPMIGERRAITTSDPELEPLINDNDSFILELEIRETQNIRRVKLEDGTQQVVTRKQIQRLIRNIGIYEDTMLNFTEEGYLSSFAEGSPRKKLDTLLTATGLKEIYLNYLDSKRRVESKSKEHSPLIFQLEREQDKLERMKEDFELIRKKKNLTERYIFVERELAWFDFKAAKQGLVETQNKIEDLQEKIRVYSKEEKSYDKELKSLILEYKALIETRDVKVSKKNEQLMQKKHLEGVLEEKQRIIEEKEKEKENLLKDRRKLKKILSDEGDEVKAEFQRQLSSIREQIKSAQATLESNKVKIQKLLEEKEKINQTLEERSAIYGSLTNYERERINDTLLFKEEVSKSSFAEEIIGPIYQTITIKPEYQQYEVAIKTSIGYSLFDFVATSHQAYEEAKRIYDNLFKRNYKLNITVGRVLDEVGPRPKYLSELTLNEKLEGIIDYAVNLIEGPFAVLNYLKRFKKIVLAKPFLSSNILTDFAKKNKVNVLTVDGKSYYLSREAFTRPPRPINIKLGVDISKYQSTERIRSRLNIIEEDFGLIKQSEIRINQQLSNLYLEKRKIESQLNIFESEYSLDQQFLLVENNIDRYDQEIKSEKENVDAINEQIKTISEAIKEYEKELELLDEQIQQKLQEKESIAKKKNQAVKSKEKCLRFVTQLSADIHEMQEKVEHLQELAVDKGECPLEMRENRDEINAELFEIKGQLALIEINPAIDKQSITVQEEKVKKLQHLIEKGKTHLENLQADLERRLDHWISGLRKIVDHLNGTLKVLLDGVFENISVYIANYRDENNASLIIEAVTKGDNRRYRQLSGGEKTLIAQAIILSLHLINYSPLHVIDEFTQKL